MIAIIPETDIKSTLLFTLSPWWACPHDKSQT